MKPSSVVGNILFKKFMLPVSAGLRRVASVLALAAGLLALPTGTQAQNQVFFEDWETNHRTDNTYVTNFIALGSAVNAQSNNLADLFFDYSTAGIPLSPHSLTTNTHALKLCCNIIAGAGFPTGLSVSPVGFGITENFEMHFDAWYNFDGPMPGGGSGSTEIGGAGYGTAGTNAQVAGIADSVYIGGATDGNTSGTTNGSDFRVYSSFHPISYQGGSYRVGSDGTNATTLGDPSTGFVYAGINGGRGAGNVYFATNFPSTQCPQAQETLFPQQTNSDGTFAGQGGFTRAGALSFKWHDVTLQKVANVITYKIDGVLIATVNVVDAGPLGGSNILFNMYDINNGGDTQANGTNLLFYLVDNVRITNFANVVSVSTTNTAISDGSGVPGIFAITRTASGTPLTVSYTMTGSASNGVDYVDGSSNALSGTITFSANATTTNIFVYGVSTTIPQLTKSIILNINPSTNYTGAGNATINLLNTANPQLTITNLSSSMYERTNDFAVFQVSRLGNTNTASFPINLSFSGTGTNGVNFYTNVVATFEPGIATTNIMIYPIEDHVYTGNKTITLSIASASAGEYTIGTQNSASITLRDEDTAPETVLWSDNFNVDSSANWTVFQASGDNVPDNSYTFASDYNGVYGIPPSPHGGGDTHGLVMTVNKGDLDASAAALNFYPNGKTFSGNFALRFDMWLNSEAGQSVTTEYALAGINHAGTKTNWWRSGGITNGIADFDGVWYTIETDAQAAPNFVNYSAPSVVTGTGFNPTQLTAGTNSSGFTDLFKTPPFLFPGSPAVSYNATTPGYWSDVEIAQIGKTILLRINNSQILTYSNATPYTAGNIMLGYLDAFDSIGVVQSFEVVDNVRVVSITGLTVGLPKDLGAAIQLDFAFGLNADVSSFAIAATPALGTTPFADTAATIVQTSPGHFRATIPKVGNTEFYRVHTK